MDDFQTLNVKGTIHGQAIDQDTLINPQTFLHFEHSDGANFLMLNFIKRQRLLVSKNKKHWLSGVAKIGAGEIQNIVIHAPQYGRTKSAGKEA